jgi:L-serine dehydratase
MAFVSVLNDVLGPVMRGPSSSHTAGAYRIALLASRVLSSRPVRVRCAFDPEGSYAATFEPMGVDLAFAAALLGWEMTDERYSEGLHALRAGGTELSFCVEPLDLADHPNATRVDLVGEDGRKVRVWARSVGGGVVEIYRVDGTELMLTGKERDLLVFLSRAATAEDAPRVARFLGLPDPGRPNGGVLHFVLPPGSSEALPDTSTLAGVERLCVVDPVFHEQKGTPLFASAQQAAEIAGTEGWSLGETARRYEARILGETPAWVDAEIQRRFQIMADSVAAGLRDDRVHMPLLSPTAGAILQATEERRLPSGGPLTRAAARAMAAMHTCNSRGVVCAAPTGGSAGVIPGVLLTLREERRLTDRQVADALLAASAVGLIVAVRATFAAEIAGCQVEIGAAGAMAAAAVVEATGGSVAQAFAAASIALQNTMGSVCDPVQGGCEIPCHTRNAVAAASAFVCADLVMGGYANPIPLDESVDASLAVGMSLPRELRCTALGGIAAAPSARAMRAAR